jgi:hypothetical protein
LRLAKAIASSSVYLLLDAELCDGSIKHINMVKEIDRCAIIKSVGQTEETEAAYHALQAIHSDLHHREGAQLIAGSQSPMGV